MDRLEIPPRPDWRHTAEAVGFDFHTLYDLPYWTESACYRFRMEQIEDHLEEGTSDLWSMALALVERAARDDEVLHSLGIPPSWWDTVRNSWLRRDKDLYARADLCYDGRGPPVLLEWNADTPTSLFESAFFQWVWLEQAMDRGLIPQGCDQFNSVQEALLDGFASLGPGFGPGAGPVLGGRTLYLTSIRDHAEDHGTVAYLRDIAHQAGLATHFIAIEDIGVDAQGRLTDLDDFLIQALFKLYPWEWLMEEPFGPSLQGPHAPQMIEPAWKAVLSNKGALVWLWRLFPGHPNLLPACFSDAPDAAVSNGPFVEKPLLSREGANIRLVNGAHSLETGGPYGDGPRTVFQSCRPLPVFSDGQGQQHHAVIGSWIAAGRACGIGMREDDTPITRDTSRFVPHLIMPG